MQVLPEEVNYLGHIISAEGVRTDPKKVSAVKNWKRPETSVSCEASWDYVLITESFVKGFSNIARPLHKLTEKILKARYGMDTIQLNEYYFGIRHRKGSSHGNADALSKRHAQKNCRHCSIETKYEAMLTPDNTSTATPPDPWGRESSRRPDGGS
ncbi:retrovirus-related Pol polyprotein from transposon 297 [Trichonephila clavipes]|nr:retrovirus-related Pol polyprotein from transposon 297 [Trichonephila clavipes]